MPRVLLGFENHDGGPLAQDESITLTVEGTTGASRLVIAAGERTGVTKAGDGKGNDGRFCRPGDDDLSFATPQNVHRFEQRLIAARAGRSGSDYRSTRPV